VLSDNRRFHIHFVAAAMVLVSAIWLASGTMAPYAATLKGPVISETCHYLYNTDHRNFRASFAMLDGQPRSEWGWSVYLRRILYPLVSYPFMKALGFEWGGLVFNVLLHLAALYSFARFVRARIGLESAIWALWLLCTYPGIGYWAGLPYSNAAIVPSTLCLFMLLVRLDEESEPRSAALVATAMGILFTAYDLLPFFAPAAVGLVAWRRRFHLLPGVVAGLIAPQLISNIALALIYKVTPNNSNTHVFGAIARAYLHRPDLGMWAGYLRDLPEITFANYFYSNFLFLPALFLVLILLWQRPRIGPVEIAVWIAGATVFLIANLAPPYRGWQLRGIGIPRLYQPLFVLLIWYCVRCVQAPPAGRRRLVIALMTVTIFANASIAFGAISHNPAAGYLNYRFYEYFAEPDAMTVHLDFWGRRPLGVCR
jgi:hypothetical protein